METLQEKRCEQTLPDGGETRRDVPGSRDCLVAPQSMWVENARTRRIDVRRLVGPIPVGRLRIPIRGDTLDINLTLRLLPERDDTSLAEISELPGALAPGVRATDSCARAIALALRIVADRLEHHESVADGLTPDGRFTLRISLEDASRIRWETDAMRNTLDKAISASLSPNVEEQLFNGLRAPLSESLTGMRQVLVDSLELNERWAPTRASEVLQRLEADGWSRKRANPHFTVLARSNRPDVCFPFDDLYTLRPVALQRLAALTGLLPFGTAE